MPQGTQGSKVPCAFSVLFAIAVTALIVVVIEQGNASSDRANFTLRIPPAEFLYLDGARILDYLAELEGGSVAKIHRITKEINSVSGEATVGEAKIGASSQRENEADSTITRTESSELGLLLSDLRADRWPGVALHWVKLREPSDLEKIHEGWLVRFETQDLLSPGYIRPYVVVRQSATLAALFPQAAGNPEGVEHAELQRAKAEAFANKVGPNPRVTFAVASPNSASKSDPLKILLPMQYRDLTTERSLLEREQGRYTGGKLVVIGKVIRLFEAEKNTCSPGEVGCQPAYADFATREIWRTPLEHASNFLIDHVSHSCVTHHTKPERRQIKERLHGTIRQLKDVAAETIEGRECFLAKLQRQTRLYRPGAVILPLAVYK
jgi:hypothetical protein